MHEFAAAQPALAFLSAPRRSARARAPRATRCDLAAWVGSLPRLHRVRSKNCVGHGIARPRQRFRSIFWLADSAKRPERTSIETTAMGELRGTKRGHAALAAER